MSVIAASGGEDVHRKTTDKPKAKSKTTKLQLGVVAGTLTFVSDPLGPPPQRGLGHGTF